MSKLTLASILAVLLLAGSPMRAAEPPSDSGNWLETWLAASEPTSPDAAPKAADTDTPPKEPPPLPFHCIEGYSGGPITPMAYICNTGPAGSVFGKPVISYTFVDLGSKDLHVVSVTQSFFGRVELGYAYNNLSLGSLRSDLKKAGLNPGRNNVQLHHFNLRYLLLPENSFDLPLPAVTAGVHFKYNNDIKKIDKSLGGAFKNVGYKDDFGIDYTITATKMFPQLAFGRPVILTAGLRLSKAAELGLLGFGNRYRPTVEASAVCLATDWLALAYEFRQKRDPYNDIGNIVCDEANWQAFSASVIVSENLTISAVYGMFGNVINANADCTLGIQAKWEF